MCPWDQGPQDELYKYFSMQKMLSSVHVIELQGCLGRFELTCKRIWEILRSREHDFYSFISRLTWTFISLDVEIRDTTFVDDTFLT